MSEKLEIEGLIKVLGHETDCDVRRKAAKAFGKIGDSRAVEPLIMALNNENTYIHYGAADALGDPQYVCPSSASKIMS